MEFLSAIRRYISMERSIGREIIELIKEHGSFTDIDKLLEHSANPRVRDYGPYASEYCEGYTALHYAAGWRGAGCSHYSLVRMLNDNGAGPNIRPKYGQTDLHLFAFEEDVDCMKLLLMAGASRGVYDTSGHTALHNAASYGNAAVAGCLLRYGFNANAHKRKVAGVRDGYTPIHSAIIVQGDESTRLRTIRSLRRGCGPEFWNWRRGGRPNRTATRPRAVKPSPVVRFRGHRSISLDWGVAQSDRDAL